MLNIAVLVSGGGTNLQALIDAEKAGKIENGKISVVVASKPGVYALERAKNAGIEGIVLARSDYENVDAYSEALENLLKEKHTDLIVLAGFMTITNEKFTKAFENKIINVHPALIPSFCGKGYYGLHVHEAALARGVKVSGATGCATAARSSCRKRCRWSRATRPRRCSAALWSRRSGRFCRRQCLCSARVSFP